ncbi:MAG: glycine--tRNA ligase subunit beta [Deltaproteobacteria bacterium]|nr:glycine--tRNA ligase subunit beta [Deltaproteobacteria bacterium]
MAKELLLEIGVEELPAAFLPKAVEALQVGAERMFKENAIKHGNIAAFATPRRLCLRCESVAERQENQLVEKVGPAIKGAHDADGKPSRALLGFSKGQGMEIADLAVVKTEKGEYFVARKRIIGGITKDLLPSLLLALIESLPFKRSMRWSDIALKFARPIHWLVALYDGEVIPFAVANIRSGNITYGHRFMSQEKLTVSDFADYQENLRKAFVIVSPSERKEMIVAGAQKIASDVGGSALINQDLLTEVAFLVEYPYPICGSFPSDYLLLPREVLITTMMTHQRYFPVVDSNGVILPYFITIANTNAKDPVVVRKGNEKVIRARLKDAEFFFKEDQKVPLTSRVEGLKKVVYHSQMGTSFEKMERFKALAEYLGNIVAPNHVEAIIRAAFLSKADLDTQMVGEFPELQGIMGREYALRQGESAKVALAIHEHYFPTVAGGPLPTSAIGAVVSIADKTDTIVGFFGVGLAPTGTADPYAMRRQALGIINIVIEHGFSFSFISLIERSILILGNKLQVDSATMKKEVLEFFRARLENMLVSQGYSNDIVDAVCSVGMDDIFLAAKKVKAMEAFRQNKDFQPLAVAFKRAKNIIKDFSDGRVDPSCFVHEAESNLYASYLEVKLQVESLIISGNIKEAIEEMAKLRFPIDDFFQKIMVMDEDEKVRFNRQSLLAEIFGLFANIADFSRIAVEQKR